MDFISAIVTAVFTEKEPLIIEKKLPKDLTLYDFIIFYEENGVKFSKMFGVFKVVSTKRFIIDDFGFIAGTQIGAIYQVRAKADGSLFLQGRMSVFVYNYKAFYIYKYQKWLRKRK